MITPKYDDIQVIPDRVLESLRVKEGLDIVSNPFNVVEGLAGEKLFSPQDIAFVNTSEFSRTGKYFIDNGTYTKAHPVYDKTEYDAFWDEEERKCIEGITMPGKLLRDFNGNYCMQNIHITGEHYGYLNFSQMKKTKEKKIVGGVLESDNGELLKRINKGADKHIEFPDFWSGDYFYFKAKEVARSLGYHMVVGKSRRKGYEQPNSEIIMTPNGETTMGELRVGDKVLSPYGKVSKVLEVYPQGKKDIYEIEFRDGRKVKCGLNHLWFIQDSRSKKRIVNTEFFLNKTLVRNEGKSNQYYAYSIPPIGEAYFDKQELPINPYALGILIGDGSLTQDTVLFSTDDKFILDEMINIFPDNEIVYTGAKFQYRINGYGRRNWIMQELRTLGLDKTAKHKFIPDIYKYTSYEDRLALVQGLMDSDGTSSKGGNARFVTASEQLSKDIVYVLRSIGVRTYTDKRETVGYGNGYHYVISITTDKSIFRLPRKLENINSNRNYKFGNIPIISVKKLDYQEESSCILIDSKNHIYLTKDFIPTHNSYKNGWIAANRVNLIRNSVTVLGAFVSDSLYPEGTMTMADNYLQFLNKHTDWKKRRLIDREDFIKLGYKHSDSLGVERGYLSRIICVSFGPNNPGAARGKDADLVLIEEAGKCPNLSDVLDGTLPTLRDGSLVTGMMIVFGTGGGDGKLWEGFEELFFSPSSENFMSFENIWDDDSRGTECGFFIPTEENKRGFVDKHGNSDKVAAVTYEKGEREKRKRRGSSKLNGYIMEEPFCPTEAFSRKQDSILPIQQLAEQLKRVQRDTSIQALVKHGNIVHTDKGFKFKDYMFATDKEKEMMYLPITDFPIKPQTDVRGSVMMWAPPYRIDTPYGRIVPDGLYRAWHDPYAVPKETKFITSKDSLGCTYIYEKVNNFTQGFGDRLVACFVGRRDTTDQYNDELFNLLKYYNAKLMFENDRGDVLNYARQKKCLELLEDEPDVLWKKALQTSKTGRNKGMHMNVARKENGIIYYRDWLLTKRGNDENGKELLNLHYIYDEALLKESIKWNMKGNFDRISTMLIGMFDIKEQFSIEVKKPMVNNSYTSTNIFDRELY